MKRIRIIRVVDPRIDPAVRMIDPQSIAFTQNLADPGADEFECRSRGIQRAEEMWIKDRIAPGLTVRVRPTGRGSHPVAGQEQLLPRPSILQWPVRILNVFGKIKVEIRY